MDRQRTEGPSTLLERAGLAAGAGACGAALAAAGCYTFIYGIVSLIASQGFDLMAGNAASGTIAELFLLGLAVAMSVGGGAILSRALGVSTWRRSTLLSGVAHAIGVALWIMAWNYLMTSYPERWDVYSEEPLRSYLAAAYAFVVPLLVVFSSYRRDAPGGLVVALFLAVATAALPVASVLRDSEGLALASGVVAWVVLPAITVLGSAITGPRSH
jgi:hypothetical protein